MKNKKTVLFPVFRYFVPADYELWLEELAKQGWHCDDFGQKSSLVAKFVKGEPKKYRYVFDIQPFVKKDYKQTYQDFGWEFVGQMASAFVWRKEYSAQRPESFSDSQSLINRNKRFIHAISFSFILMVLASAIVTVSFILNFPTLQKADYAQFLIGILVAYSATFYLGGVMRKINKHKER